MIHTKFGYFQSETYVIRCEDTLINHLIVSYFNLKYLGWVFSKKVNNDVWFSNLAFHNFPIELVLYVLL